MAHLQDPLGYLDLCCLPAAAKAGVQHGGHKGVYAIAGAILAHEKRHSLTSLCVRPIRPSAGAEHFIQISELAQQLAWLQISRQALACLP